MPFTLLSPEEYYPIDCLLGEGAFSVVYRGYDHKHDRYVAIKRINLLSIRLTSPSESVSDKVHDILQTAITELKVYQRIPPHKFILQLYAAYPVHLTCYLVMHCLSTDLRRILKLFGPIPEHSALYIVACIGSALHHLHLHGVIHRDVKPENISLDESGIPYLTDFGISSVNSQTNSFPICFTGSGTPPYMAPEILAPDKGHSYQVDFWSLGVTAFELISNNFLFYPSCPLHMVQFVANNYYWMWRELAAKTQTFQSLSLFDFDSLSNTDPSSELPYPEYEEIMNDDGTLPPALQPPLPERASLYGITEYFKSLLFGLLDVRIPRRLGNMLNYNSFSDHPAFIRCGYVDSALTTLRSPFYGCGYLNRVPALHHLTIPPPLKLERKDMHKFLTLDMKHMLSQFRYFPKSHPAEEDKLVLDEPAASLKSKAHLMG